MNLIDLFPIKNQQNLILLYFLNAYHNMNFIDSYEIKHGDMSWVIDNKQYGSLNHPTVMIGDDNKSYQVKLITYGYLDALCEYFKVDYKTRKDRLDIFDLSIHQAAKEVFDELIFLRKEDNSVNLFDSRVKLDMKIRQQKKIF